jgi:DNA topoisomerase I
LGDLGQTGLITYMRTDSFRLSEEAISMARDTIESVYGREYLPQKPNRFKSRKGAQEAHEAIRPTSVELDPKRVAPFLSKEQLALYTLIWNRFMACQMSPARYDQTQIEIAAGRSTFSASGSILLFKGFTVLYEEEAKEDDSGKREDEQLPPLREGQSLRLVQLEPAQHFTQPPPRFTEATLIKALEENGIGRPSTYAAILANINKREYVSKEKGRFRPTELGFLVTDLLVESFPEIFNTDFTAQMEDNLDKIERGEAKWNAVLNRFYDSFHQSLEKAEHEMKREVQTELLCPDCGRPMAIKSGRNGIFLACTGYPQCRHTSNFTRDEKGHIVVESPPEVEESEETCRVCGRPMVLKKGKYGTFLACSGYPECKNTQALQPVSTNVPCPEKGCTGTLVERSSKKGRRFYGCSAYPDCRFMTWDEPFKAECPKCGSPILNIKTKKDSEPFLTCPKKGCNYKAPLPSAGDE